VTDKTWFRVIDYTNATRLFDEWDRPPGDPTELPEKPWSCEVRIVVIDGDTGSRVADVWAIAVAAPNEQVSFSLDGGNLVANQLPPATISVHLRAPGYRDRQVKVDASLEAGPITIELRPLEEQVERIVLSGLQVDIAAEVVLTVDATGQQMTVPEYLAYAKGAILELVEDPDALTSRWIDHGQRDELVSELERRGVHLSLVADLERVHDADEHDVASFLAFDTRPLPRRAERVEAFLNRNHDWLEGLSESQQAIALELVQTYLDGGVSQLQRSVLRLERFQSFGGTVGVIGQFGGTEGFDRLLEGIARRLYPADGRAA
jgi:type I restriction enzyme R subunit